MIEIKRDFCGKLVRIYIERENERDIYIYIEREIAMHEFILRTGRASLSGIMESGEWTGHIIFCAKMVVVFLQTLSVEEISSYSTE